MATGPWTLIPFKYLDLIRFVQNPTFHSGVNIGHMPYEEAISGLNVIDERENDLKVADYMYYSILKGLKRIAKRRLRIRDWLFKDLLEEVHSKDYIASLEFLEKLAEKYGQTKGTGKSYNIPYHYENMRHLSRLASRRARKGCREASAVDNWFNKEKGCIA